MKSNELWTLLIDTFFKAEMGFAQKSCHDSKNTTAPPYLTKHGIFGLNLSTCV